MNEMNVTESTGTWSDNYTQLLNSFKSRYPMLETWKTNGFFTDDYLLEINPHWLQYDPVEPRSHFIVAFVYILIFTVGSASNALVFFLIASRRRLRTPANLLVANLAVSDFFMLLKTPVFVYNSFLQGPATGRIGCNIYGFMGGLTGTASIMTLAAVAIDRYLVISRPLDIQRKTSRTRARLMIVFIWIYSLIFSSLPLWAVGKYVPEGFLTSCSFDYMDSSTGNRLFIFSFFVAAWLLPFSLITFCYVSIFRAVRQSVRSVEPTADSNINRYGIELNIAKITAGLVALWIISWTPYASVALLGIFGYSQLITPAVSMIPALFCKAAACFNPFIYALSHPKIKEELGKHFQAKLLKKQSHPVVHIDLGSIPHCSSFTS